MQITKPIALIAALVVTVGLSAHALAKAPDAEAAAAIKSPPEAPAAPQLEDPQSLALKGQLLEEMQQTLNWRGRAEFLAQQIGKLQAEIQKLQTAPKTPVGEAHPSSEGSH